MRGAARHAPSMAASSRPPTAAAASVSVERQRAIDDGALACEGLLVDAGAATGEAATATAEAPPRALPQRSYCRCPSRRARQDRLRMRRADRIEESASSMAGFREVGGWGDRARAPRHGLRRRRACELVDGGAAASELRDHLRGDLRRKGGDALRRHAMISGKDEYLDALEVRRALPRQSPSHSTSSAAQAPPVWSRTASPRARRAAKPS